jgi:hypothetical protein
MQQPEINALLTQVSKPIKWVVPDSIRTDHATHLIVQQQGSEFTFLFSRQNHFFTLVRQQNKLRRLKTYLK